MKTKLSDLVIMSDLDGTLLPKASGGTPQRNTDALKRFIDKGGRFGVATGRSTLITEYLLDQLPVNFPSIVLNGGAVYDFAAREYLAKIFLPEMALEYAKRFRADFPDIGVVCVHEHGYLDIGGVTREKHYERYPNPLLTTASFDDVASPPFKFAFLTRPEDGPELAAYARRQTFPGVRFVFSHHHMFEMLPVESSKGAAMETIAKMTGVARENIVAIGDYYNDVEMLEYAGLGVTLADAPDDIKQIAQMIVCPCAEGALGDLIERLEARYE